VVLDQPQGWPEDALLHLYNRLREAGGHLLIVSETPPARWPIALPDLASRLASIPAVALAAPDDDLLVAVMAKQFADRGLEVNEDVLRYVASRVERSFAAAADVGHAHRPRRAGAAAQGDAGPGAGDYGLVLRPQCFTMKSAMAGTSLRSITGSLLSLTGVSVRIAT
jgi:hypothetical protein